MGAITIPEDMNLKVEKVRTEDGDASLMSDVYDLFTEVIKIHTPGLKISSDFTISNLNEKEIKFVREHIKVCKILRTFLGGKYRKTIKKTGKHYEIKEGDVTKRIAKQVTNVLMTDVFSLVILSRAKGGKILDAVLSYGTISAASASEHDEPEKKGLMKRLAGG